MEECEIIFTIGQPDALLSFFPHSFSPVDFVRHEGEFPELTRARANHCLLQYLGELLTSKEGVDYDWMKEFSILRDTPEEAIAVLLEGGRTLSFQMCHKDV